MNEGDFAWLQRLKFWLCVLVVVVDMRGWTMNILIKTGWRLVAGWGAAASP